MLGGLYLQAKVQAFYEQSDRRNVLRVLEHSGHSDIRLLLAEQREFKKL